MSAKKYRVLVGINWPDGQGGERRAEPGDSLTAAELKGADVKWLLDIGAIEADKEAPNGV